MTHQSRWPPPPCEAWRDTYATLHTWTQIAGKICLALTPPTNHILPCAAVRTARSPEDALSAFLASTYTAAADLAQWNRAELERKDVTV